ncbi:RDD family protein [Rhizohabitans arisaemae]|uniref:RDD family protein n=1 Tax=Rhizohabitans arisaemae TaxID=2720610 RepID=UPI0024B04572|nr:RDD family protein [Rhizohabitans arisaemae]
MSDVVTGDAVVLDVRVAQLPSRGVAFLIDFVAQTVAYLGFVFLLGAVIPRVDPALATAIYIGFAVLIYAGYPIVFETLSRGRSLGKLAMGLRVVGDDGGPVRFRQALVRGLAGVIELYGFSGSAAVITSLANRRGKRLGDVFAGTIVIGERASYRAVPPPAIPPGLAAWAGTLELSRLPVELANTARQYLLRGRELAPDVHREMGARIANTVIGYISPPPPPGLPPETFLAAVLAERRTRHERRLRTALARNVRPAGRPAHPRPEPSTDLPTSASGFAPPA